MGAATSAASLFVLPILDQIFTIEHVATIPRINLWLVYHIHWLMTPTKRKDVVVSTNPYTHMATVAAARNLLSVPNDFTRVHIDVQVYMVVPRCLYLCASHFSATSVAIDE